MAAPGVNTGMRKVYVVGVGMTKFEKPGRRENFDYPDMAKEAGTKALEDAGLSYDAIEQACVGYVYGDSTCGQRALYQLGMTGIPVYNVNNNCATGSTALVMAKQLIQGGMADCVMALGFEKMQRGSLKATFTDRASPMSKHVQVNKETYGRGTGPLAAQMFGNAGREHMEKYGTKPEHFAKIAWKNHKHSTNNPYSQFQDYYTLDQIQASPKVHDPLTKLQCCPTSDGSAAAILCSEEFVHKHNLESQAVEIVAMEMATDLPSAFKDKSCIKMVGYDMAKKAADKVFQEAGLNRDDVQVVELHDCFSCNELITYEALGLCPPGKAGEMVDKGDNTYGGKYVVNPSGGLISKGHPLGATGLAQCSELCWQLRGMANKRQVNGVKVALQHNIGLGGAAVVGLYRLGFPQKAASRLQAVPASTVSPESFKCNAIFNGISDVLKQDGANLVKKMNGVFCFQVKGDSGEGIWIVDCKNGNGSVKFGGPAKGDVTIMMSDQNLVDLLQGKLNPQTAFFHGKLKIKGNTALAMKLKDLKMPEGGVKAASAGASTGSGSSPGSEFKVAPVFDLIKEELNKDGANIVKKMKGVFCFRVKNADGKEGIWVVDAKNGAGSVSYGGPAKGDVTILMGDEDMLNLMSGKLNPQSAFFQGKLKIQGNMGLAMKLKELQPKGQSKL
ncbi:sterol carrier protein 2-like isoform X3 [Mercenaria mercenaria]|uniref:sterol carrier protein 2-like isoform X3 n=1 Tax=Mercenaria mercenaria TaxID=6596 RepID=UPI00234F4327|nr:sterol carrier protein 2-like isoform X3 [Mercenaria mercenaria]